MCNFGCDPDGLVQCPIPGCPLKSIGEGASSPFGGRPESLENVSCSGATPHMHRCNLGVAPEQETFSGLPDLPPKRLLAPSPIDLRGHPRIGHCARPSGSQPNAPCQTKMGLKAKMQFVIKGHFDHFLVKMTLFRTVFGPVHLLAVPRPLLLVALSLP